MNGKERDPKYKGKNIRILRRYFGMSQKEFIDNYLSDEDGNPTMSIATLSNLESKGGKRINEVILKISEKLSVDSMIFYMNPEEFSEKIDLILPNHVTTEIINQKEMKNGNIDRLLNRLTMYFAEQIFEKKLKKGDKIESDRVLAQKMNVGRSAIREALKVLEVMGMIDIRRGQGSYISRKGENFFVVPLAWSLFLDSGQINDILVVRNLLEVKAAELAAQSSDEDCFMKIHETILRCNKAFVEHDYKSFLEEDLNFHLCIAECSGNAVIVSMIQTIQNLIKRISGTGMVDEAQFKEIYIEHKEIYGFLMAKDGQGASNAMGKHLENAIHRYNFL